MAITNEELLKLKTLTERELNLIKRRANDGKLDLCDLRDEYELSPEQCRKGFDWIMNQYKTPRGVERKNNPFGYREENVINTYKKITCVGFFDAGNVHHSFYVPIYRAYGASGTFEYYVAGGAINIIN